MEEAGLDISLQWPVRAVERYGGPWNRTLANRILILNNMADPYTSVASARSVVENLRESAIFVITQGIGHWSVLPLFRNRLSCI